jgi:hypothetical protein
MEMLTALDDLEAAWDKLASLPVRTLSAGQVLAVLDRLETQRRRQPPRAGAHHQHAGAVHHIDLAGGFQKLVMLRRHGVASMSGRSDSASA